MEIKFIPATLADAEALLDVQIRSFHDDARIYPELEPGGPPGYDSLEALQKLILERPFYKIVQAGRIIGEIILEDMGEGHYYLDTLVVDPDYHNQGVGTQAMHFLEATYPARKWTLYTPIYSTRNHHFYEKFGYVKVGESHDGNVALILYEKTM
jgi:GNAT superfamily N-acetyltransferase